MEDNKAKASILDSLITSIDNNKQIVLYIGRGKNGSACELNYDPEQLFILTLDKEIKYNPDLVVDCTDFGFWNEITKRVNHIIIDDNVMHHMSPLFDKEKDFLIALKRIINPGGSLYLVPAKTKFGCEIESPIYSLFGIKCNIICFSNKQFGKLLNDSFNDEVLKKIEGYEIFSKQIVHLNEQYPHWISGQVDCFYQFIC
uniref:Uncharacterized protein n=1 Tax=viral metagenome TaxID=1070528 RepID=A0A6C0LUX1_9ZZZZ